MNTVLRAVNTLLLLAILATLFLIWQRMPPTIGELRAGKTPAEKHALALRSPYIRPTIIDSVSVDVAQPLEVKIAP